MTPLEQFDREEQARFEIIRNSLPHDMSHSIPADFLKSHDSKRAEIVAREAVEERIAMIREEIRDVAEPYPGAKWLNKLDAEWILTLPSLQLPASDSDTRA